MLRHLLLPLVLCVCAVAPLRGQNVAVPEPATPDTVAFRAHQAAHTAAGERGVGGYFAVSYLAGVPTGVMLPVALVSSDPTATALGGAGVAVILGTTAAADRGADQLPEYIVLRLEHESPHYQRTFRTAYAEQLTRRRARAGLWGGAAGVGTGLGLVVWVVSQLNDL